MAARVTVHLGEDEWWPWIYFARKSPYAEAVDVDRETAERWGQGIKAAEALQAEMYEALNSARDKRLGRTPS